MSVSHLPISIRLALANGVCMPMILRGTPLPVRRHKTLTPLHAYQDSVEFRLLFGESPLEQYNKEFASIPLAFAEKTKSPGQLGAVFITIEIEATGLVKIRYGAGLSLDQKEETIGNISELISAEDISRLLHTAELTKAEAEEAEKTANLKTSATKLIQKAEEQLRELQRSPHSEASSERLEQAIAAVGIAMDSAAGSELSIAVLEKETKRLRDLLDSTAMDAFSMFNDIFGSMRQPNTPAQNKSRAEATTAPTKTDGASLKRQPTIFIGHGRAPVWRELKDFVCDRLGLKYEEFNREPTAGLANKERLKQMLDAVDFALIVLTAEDEHSDGTKHPRLNAVHEAGLFQGRLGFEKAILIVEEGCTNFSNIEGLTQIRFPRGQMKGAYEEVRGVLEREGIL